VLRRRQDEGLGVVLGVALQVSDDALEKVGPVHVDVLKLGGDVQVQLEHARHVVEEHVEGLLVPGGEPRADPLLHLGEQRQVAVAQVVEGLETRVFEDDEVPRVVALVRDV
jgi:hypothetical protein